MKTLNEQITEIHKRNFGAAFHMSRLTIIPAMVNDLKMKFFDDLELENLPADSGFPEDNYWFLDDSVDIRAVKKASELIRAMSLRDSTPAVE